MKKKVLIVVLLSIFFGLVSMGCQRQEAFDGVTLRFHSWRTEDVAMYAELISRFERDNPGIRVIFQPFRTEEYQTILATNFQAGTPGDVIHLRAYGNLEQFAAPGFLLPLTVEDIPELSLFSATSLGGSTSISTGRIYGVPYASQSLVIFYNRDIYQRLGLRVPETWDEYIANLEAIAAAGITPIGNGTLAGWAAEVMWGTIAPNAYGGNTFWNQIQAGETNFLDPRFIASVERFQSLLRFMPSGFVGLDYVGSQMMFINEMAAHFHGGIWEAAYFEAQNPDLNFGIFVAPPNVRGGPMYISSYMDGSFGIAATTPHRAEAIRFLRFLASRETQQFISDQLGIMTEHPEVRFTNRFLQVVSQPNLIPTPYVFLVGFRYEQPSGSVLMQTGLQGLAAGTMTPLEVAENVQRGIEIYFAPFQR